MRIKRYCSDLLQSNMYVISEGRRALVIDPYRHTAPAKDLSVDCILLTHEHYDHISGVNLWRETTSSQVACSKTCAQNIGDSRRNCARYFEAFMEMQSWIKDPGMVEIDRTYTCQADLVLDHDQEFSWQGHRIRCVALPGHSPGSMGYLLDEKHFFSGDSVIPGNPPELRFPGGNKTAWQETAKPRLLKLARGITVWPGHFHETDSELWRSML